MATTFRVSSSHRLAIASLVALVGAVTGVTTTRPAQADYEVVAHGVGLYGGGGLQCSGTIVDDTEEVAEAFQLELGNQGYDAYYLRTNTAVDSIDWKESGSDEVAPEGSDWADVAYFGGHAGATCPMTVISDRRIELVMGDNSGDCTVGVGGASYNEVEFASGGSNSDANYLMTFASNSLQYCAAQSGNMIFRVDDGGSSTQFVLHNGFHNSPADISENVNEAEDYVNAGLYNAVGDAWGDIMAYRGGFVIECTVSNVTSSSQANADNAFLWGGFFDFKDTGSHVQTWYYYDCARQQCDDPSEVDPLPWC